MVAPLADPPVRLFRQPALPPQPLIGDASVASELVGGEQDPAPSFDR